MLIEGRTSFFCFEAGRISSRSTGTPSETRKSRRIRDLTQFWGCSGGGATSCDHRDRERSVLKMAEEFWIGSTGGREAISFVVGNKWSRGSSRAAYRSGRDWNESKSINGGCDSPPRVSVYGCDWRQSSVVRSLEVGNTHNGGWSGRMGRDRLWLLESVIKVIKVPKVIFAHVLFFGEIIKLVRGLGICCLVGAF